MKNCEKYRELCSAIIDGELSLEEQKQLSKHIAQCPACAAYLEDLHQMKNAWDSLKQPLPNDMHEYIMQGVLKEAYKSVKTKRHFPVFTTIAAVAACVMLVLSGAVGDIISMTANQKDNDSAKPTGKLVMEDTDQKETYNETEESEPVQPEVQEQTQPRVVEPEQNQQTEVQPRVAQVPQDNQEQQTQQPTQQQTKQQTNSEQIQPATFAVDPQMERNATQNQSVEIPAELQTSSFAFCCIAVGQGEVPAIENAEFIQKNNNTYYFRVTSVINDFNNTILQLKESGFEATMRTDLGVRIDESASNGLLVLVVNQ